MNHAFPRRWIQLSHAGRRGSIILQQLPQFRSPDPEQQDAGGNVQQHAPSAAWGSAKPMNTSPQDAIAAHAPEGGDAHPQGLSSSGQIDPL